MKFVSKPDFREMVIYVDNREWYIGLIHGIIFRDGDSIEESYEVFKLEIIEDHNGSRFVWHKDWGDYDRIYKVCDILASWDKKLLNETRAGISWCNPDYNILKNIKKRWSRDDIEGIYNVYMWYVDRAGEQED